MELPADYVTRDVELGWAVTGYGNQGDTVDIGLAVLEPGTTRNHAYVALTRGRTENTAWLPDPTGLADPADDLTTILTRATDQQTALATRADLYRRAGIEPPDAVQQIDCGRTGPGLDRAPPTPGTTRETSHVEARSRGMER